MARPCRNATEEDGRQRLCNAFWSLLDEYELRDLSVSMVVAKAGCNRGTFYYHFHDMKGLIELAVSQDLVAGGRTVTEALFGIATNNVAWCGSEDVATRFTHLCLLMEKGGMKLVNDTAKRAVFELWRAVLCPDGSQLTPQTQLVLHYHASGLLGALSYLSNTQPDESIEGLCSEPCLKEASDLLLRQLSQAQGVPVEEITARLATASSVMHTEA